MKVTFFNLWKSENRDIYYQYIIFFSISWQFDNYYKGIIINIFNFLITFEFLVNKERI